MPTNPPLKRLFLTRLLVLSALLLLLPTFSLPQFSFAQTDSDPADGLLREPSSGAAVQPTRPDAPVPLTTARPQATTTDDWVMQLAPNVDPVFFAQQRGYIYRGQVANLEGFYLFRLPDAPTPNSAQALQTNQQLEASFEVITAEQMLPYQLVTYQQPTLDDPLYPDQWHLNNTGQFGGAAGNDISVPEAWAEGVSGDGVHIGIIDDGLQYTHPEFVGRYQFNRSYDYADDDNDPLASSSNTHGTMTAGVYGAEDNTVCGIGVAYDATLSAQRLITGIAPTPDLVAATLLNSDATDPTPVNISNNSWGPPANASNYGFSATIDAAFEQGSEAGTVYVFSAGNSAALNNYTSRGNFVQSRYTIGVGALNNQGVLASYSETGPAIFVTAPSDGGGAGITTADLVGNDGLNGVSGQPECTDNFGGTSAAAPQVTGVVALMLEANPDLSWRDVQHILAIASDQVDAGDASWQTNGAGLLTSDRYGFGRVNAQRAVQVAKTWTLVGDDRTETFGAFAVNQTIPNGTGTRSGNTINPVYGAPLTNAQTVNTQVIEELEHVELWVKADHIYGGDLRVRLTSPSGTVSTLAQPTPIDLNYRDGQGWRLMSVQFWGEDPNGQWTLEVADGVENDIFGDPTQGTLEEWQLILHGTASAQAPDANVVINTNNAGVGSFREALTFAEANPGTTITFNIPGEGPHTINLQGALPQLDFPVTIQGPENETVILQRQTGGNYTLLDIASAQLVTVRNLTLSGGSGKLFVDDGVQSQQGGNLVNTGNALLDKVTITNGTAESGGGIINFGTLAIQNSRITSNAANNEGKGGGLYNQGLLTLRDTRLDDNTSSGFGGGIYNINALGVAQPAQHRLVLDGVTIDGNSATTGSGGIFNRGLMLVTNSTISDNEAGNQGGGISNGAQMELNFVTIVNNRITGANDLGQNVLLRDSNLGIGETSSVLDNSVISGPRGDSLEECYRAQNNLFTFSAYNVVSDTSCSLVGTNQQDLVPGLEALSDNGGPTLTHGLLDTSPAIDYVPQGACTWDHDGDPGTDRIALNVDQRDVTRPNPAGQCDSGAFESNVPIPPEVESINLLDPNPTGLIQVRFQVVFSEVVNGVDASDFQIITSGLDDPSLMSVTGQGALYTVTVKAGPGDGTLGLRLVDNDSITDIGALPLGGDGEGNGTTDSPLYTVEAIRRLDVNSDGWVTPVDLAFIVNRLGQAVPPADIRADINGDDQVTLDDVSPVRDALGTQIPE